MLAENHSTTYNKEHCGEMKAEYLDKPETRVHIVLTALFLQGQVK